MKKLNTLACMSILCLAAGPLYAAGTQSQQTTGTQSQQTTGAQSQQASSIGTEATSEKLQNARETAREAAQVVKQMKSEPELSNRLQQAKAVFIVPDYDRASQGGVAGGQGVLVVNRDGEWTGPAFYNIGSLNIGVTEGAETDATAFLIMSDEAMQGFRSGAYNFSLDADAGLTVIDWSARDQAASSEADVIAWSDTGGRTDDVVISVTDVFWDDEANLAYYDRSDLAANDVLQGTVRDPMASSSPLTAEFVALQTVSVEAMTEEQQNARETVREAAQVVEQIKTEPGARNALQQAKAVFILPDYGRASLGVGAAGGQGVLMINREGEWSGPAFYNIGALNIGLAAGAEAGSIAFLIMSDDAMEGFHSPNNFSLNADAGLTIIDWSARGQVASDKGADIVVWSDTKGLYGDLAISVSNIFWDDDANQAYYDRRDLAINDILQGTVSDPVASSPLKVEFSALEMATEPSEAPMSSDKPMMEREPAAKPQGSEY